MLEIAKYITPNIDHETCILPRFCTVALVNKHSKKDQRNIDNERKDSNLIDDHHNTQIQ